MKHFINNGRFGDICHCLPAVREYALRNVGKVRMTVAEEFASILEGCSYIEAYGAPVPWSQIRSIEQYARQRFPGDELVTVACYGKDYSPGYSSWSFLRETWKLTGCPAVPESQPLVFDRRSRDREAVLKRMLRIGDKPYVLAVAAGKSSPFSGSATLLQDVKAARPDLQFVDISAFKAERVYDLIGLMEGATALVSIDTMHLHLSAAVPELPVFALICNGPTRWNRTDWNPRQYWRCTYAEYSALRSEFIEALRALERTTPRINHVWSHHRNASADTQRRCAVAQASWKAEAERAGNWTMWEASEVDLSRAHKDCGLPFARDLIEYAITDNAAPTDIISFSNADVGCVPGITGQVIDAVREKGCAFTHRFDSPTPITQPILRESEVQRLQWYPGSDWFFMSVAWWRAHRDEMPDMVIGREFWDAVLRQIMKKSGGREIPCAVWHEKHASAWDRPENRQTLPGNQHNRELATKWFAENRSNAQDPFRDTWNLVPGSVTVDPYKVNMTPVRSPHPNLVFPTRLQFQPRAINVRPR